MITWEILRGDALPVLLTLPDQSVHCVVTSPPYYGLRDYGVPGQLGLEDRPDCLGWATGESCGECYICRMVAVFREVRRVLRADGTVWLNIGDSYANDTKWGGSTSGKHVRKLHGDSGIGRRRTNTGLKSKDMMMIPSRLALALQADDWYLRSDVIWSKKTCMPENVADRPTRSHEYIYLLTKSERYFYDTEAAREPGTSGPSDVRKMVEQKERIGGKHKELDDPLSKASKDTNIGQKRGVGNPGQRNMRTVWHLGPSPFAEAHFATFPPAIPERAISAGTSERGCCATCGAPWTRIVKKHLVPTSKAVRRSLVDVRDLTADPNDQGSNRQKDGHKPGYISANKTIGWEPTCRCGDESIPCTVLDPFSGAGTTGLVAVRMGRRYIGIELNSDYAEMSERRILRDVGASSVEEAQRVNMPVQLRLEGGS